ncbi:MAG: hypothetical protein QOD03_233, partial [Verrucomicrobiota bacterium]
LGGSFEQIQELVIFAKKLLERKHSEALFTQPGGKTHQKFFS